MIPSYCSMLSWAYILQPNTCYSRRFSQDEVLIKGVNDSFFNLFSSAMSRIQCSKVVCFPITDRYRLRYLTYHVDLRLKNNIHIVINSWYMLYSKSPYKMCINDGEGRVTLGLFVFNWLTGSVVKELSSITYA